MACVALSTTGGKALLGKPAPKHLERGEERGVMICPSWPKVSGLTNAPAGGCHPLSRLAQLSTISCPLGHLEAGSTIPCVLTAEHKFGKHKPSSAPDTHSMVSLLLPAFSLPKLQTFWPGTVVFVFASKRTNHVGQTRWAQGSLSDLHRCKSLPLLPKMLLFCWTGSRQLCKEGSGRNSSWMHL